MRKWIGTCKHAYQTVSKRVTQNDRKKSDEAISKLCILNDDIDISSDFRSITSSKFCVENKTKILYKSRSVVTGASKNSRKIANIKIFRIFYILFLNANKKN